MARALVLTAMFILCGFSASADGPAAGGTTTDAGKTEESTPAVDLEAAAGIFQKSCRACHGNRAQGASSYPSLSDKDPADIAEKLERYRAGERIGPNSVLMIQHAKKLSDEDIASLSVYVTTAFD